MRRTRTSFRKGQTFPPGHGLAGVAAHRARRAAQWAPCLPVWRRLRAEGISFDEIARRSPVPVTRRTVQAWLAREGAA